jgi:hypothetical protein
MDSPRTRLEAALRRPEPSRAVRELARSLRDEGMSQLEMDGLFDEFRAIHESDADETLYDTILDTMDLISGWGRPDSRLYNTEMPNFQTATAGDASPPQFRVRLVGWRAAFRMVAATHLIRLHTHLGLAESKRCVDNCLAGTECVLTPKSEHDARRLATELHRCGAVVCLE